VDPRHLSTFDLNLLVVLDVLLAERNVTRAAKRLGLSQPAVSGALARLRTALGDPLLVRTGTTMTPTARALALQRELGDALQSIVSAIGDAEAFDPRTAQRTFVIAATDYVQFVLLGSLLDRIRRSAPGVCLRIVAPIDTFPWEELAAGSIDLIIAGSSARDIPTGLHRRWVFRDEIVCILRAGHPSAGESLRLERYLDLDHIEALPVSPVGLADEVLASLGHRRRLVLTLPNFLVAPYLVAQSDCCFTLARRIAEPLTEILPLALYPLPFHTPEVTIGTFWHDRVHKDPAHRWLRKQVVEACDALA
jgi:DNA-binding transcriptional LysR family regulator